MTTLASRPNAALLVVDVQEGVVERAHERDAVVANIGRLVEKARDERVPVVWVQHSDEELERGSDNWRIVRELTPGQAEPLIEKNYGDAFEDTTLGYDTTLVSDAHTTNDQTSWGAPPPRDVIAHTNLYWKYQTAPGRTAGTVETNEIDFGSTS
jgi:hypothetical protein